MTKPRRDLRSLGGRFRKTKQAEQLGPLLPEKFSLRKQWALGKISLESKTSLEKKRVPQFLSLKIICLILFYPLFYFTRTNESLHHSS